MDVEGVLVDGVELERFFGLIKRRRVYLCVVVDVWGVLLLVIGVEGLEEEESLVVVEVSVVVVVVLKLK
jgi:hypothetical protein